MQTWPRMILVILSIRARICSDIHLFSEIKGQLTRLFRDTVNQNTNLRYEHAWTDFSSPGGSFKTCFFCD
jgi:hypothetical protein